MTDFLTGDIVGQGAGGTTPNYDANTGQWGPIQVYTPAPTATTIISDPTTAHKSIVSIGVILLVTILLVELAGVNKDWAAVVGLLFLGVLLIQGMTHSGSFSQISQYPSIP